MNARESLVKVLITRQFGWEALLLTLAATLNSCMTIEEIAPPVEAAKIGSGTSVDTATLLHGRKLYIGKCAKCHAPEPIHDYSPMEWEVIMEEMIPETKLNPTEGAAVTAYVDAVLAMPRPGPGT